jgi:hypothetical protein
VEVAVPLGLIATMAYPVRVSSTLLSFLARTLTTNTSSSFVVAVASAATLLSLTGTTVMLTVAGTQTRGELLLADLITQLIFFVIAAGTLLLFDSARKRRACVIWVVGNRSSKRLWCRSLQLQLLLLLLLLLEALSGKAFVRMVRNICSNSKVGFGPLSRWVA